MESGQDGIDCQPYLTLFGALPGGNSKNRKGVNKKRQPVLGCPLYVFSELVTMLLLGALLHENLKE